MSNFKPYEIDSFSKGKGFCYSNSPLKKHRNRQLFIIHILLGFSLLQEAVPTSHWLVLKVVHEWFGAAQLPIYYLFSLAGGRRPQPAGDVIQGRALPGREGLHDAGPPVLRLEGVTRTCPGPRDGRLHVRPTD